MRTTQEIIIAIMRITTQETTIAIMRTIQEIIAIISTTIKTIPQQIPSHLPKQPHPRNQPNALFCQ